MIGIGVGLLVNLVVWPPLRDRSAARRVDRSTRRSARCSPTWPRSCASAARTSDDWVERTRDLDHDIDAAWATVRQARESGRLNPRRSAAARVRASEAFGDVLGRLEQAVAETRSMARTIARTAPVAGDPASARSGSSCSPGRRRGQRRRRGRARGDPRGPRRGRRGRAPAVARRAADQPAQHPRGDGRGRRRAAGARAGAGRRPARTVRPRARRRRWRRWDGRGRAR